MKKKMKRSFQFNASAFKIDIKFWKEMKEERKITKHAVAPTKIKINMMATNTIHGSS